MEEPRDDADLDRLLEEDEELRRDVQRGLDDIEAGRVVPHEEAMARLLERYK